MAQIDKHVSTDIKPTNKQVSSGQVQFLTQAEVSLNPNRIT
jgi:hypothetical protein